MKNDQLSEVELLLAADLPAAPEAEFRHEVLTSVRRECRAVRWDRRLKRAAFGLLLAGMGLNLIAWQERMSFGFRTGSMQMAAQDTERLTEQLADITDTDTARRYAVQLAALQGWPTQAGQFAPNPRTN